MNRCILHGVGYEKECPECVRAYGAAVGRESSNDEVKAPGSIDQRDHFGMSAAPKEKHSEAPHQPAAFINAIAEEGTKAEAVEWLQKTWNELCQAERRVRALESMNSNMADTNIALADHIESLQSARQEGESNAERMIREHNQGCLASCGKTTTYPHVRQSRNCDSRRDCPDCPKDWLIEYATADNSR